MFVIKAATKKYCIHTVLELHCGNYVVFYVIYPYKPNYAEWENTKIHCAEYLFFRLEYSLFAMHIHKKMGSYNIMFFAMRRASLLMGESHDNPLDH